MESNPDNGKHSISRNAHSISRTVFLIHILQKQVLRNSKKACFIERRINLRNGHFLFLKNKIKRKEMQQLLTVETGLMLKNIKRCDKPSTKEKDDSYNFTSERNLMGWKEHWKNNETFRFMAMCCLAPWSIWLQLATQQNIILSITKIHILCNLN